MRESLFLNPAHLHLRDPDELGSLILREGVEIAQGHDPCFPLREAL